MLIIDFVLLASLLGFVGCWWFRGVPRRTTLLAAFAALALIVGLYGVFNFRWQAAFGVGAAILFLLVLGINRIRRARSREGLPWVSGTLFTLLLVASFLPIHYFPVHPLPAPTGTYDVGSRDFEIVDQSRKGIAIADENEPRRLLVRVWYPSDNVNGLKPRRYFTKAEAKTTATAIGNMLSMPFLAQYIYHGTTNTYENAPLAAGGANLPTIIYSHGYGQFAGQNTSLMEELASHGYVIYSIHHSGDGAPAVMPNGDVIQTDPAVSEVQMPTGEELEKLASLFIDIASGETVDIRRDAILRQKSDYEQNEERIATFSADVWTEDRLFLLDTLEAGNVNSSVADIVAASDFSRTGEMGMSFGGSTAGDVCQIDVRCVAGINLDGGEFHYSSFNAHMPVPFLMMHADPKRIARMLGGNDEQTARARSFNQFAYERHDTAGIREDIYRVDLTGADHGTYSDFKWYFRLPLLNGFVGSLDPDVSLSIQNDFVRGFFDKHLKNLDSDFPTPQLAAYDSIAELDDTSFIREWWQDAHPEDRTTYIVLETNLGEIEIALYPERAPLSVANFIQYVEAGTYDGASFYRSVQPGNSSPDRPLSVLQGGLLTPDTFLGAADSGEIPAAPFAPIAHETTTLTGIPNERGVVSYARLEPGTASSEFFVNLAANPLLDTGADETADPGYASFGRVIRGLRILDRVQLNDTLPGEANADEEPSYANQLLAEPIAIERAYMRQTP